VIFGQSRDGTLEISPELTYRDHPAIGVVLLSQLVRDLGHDPAPMLAAEGLEKLSPTATVEASRELGFIRRVLAEVDEPELGILAGRRHHFSVFGMWGLAMISSTTLRGAIRVGLRFIDLTHTFLNWQFVRETGAPRLKLDEPFSLGDARLFVIERDLAAAATMAEDLLGHREVLEAICSVAGSSSRLREPSWSSRPISWTPVRCRPTRRRRAWRRRSAGNWSRG
jgi:hypothetical protein